MCLCVFCCLFCVYLVGCWCFLCRCCCFCFCLFVVVLLFFCIVVCCGGFLGEVGGGVFACFVLGLGFWGRSKRKLLLFVLWVFFSFFFFLGGKSIKGNTNQTIMLQLHRYFSFQPVLHDWCNKGCGMCYPVCGMVHIKEPLLLIGKSSLCGGSGFHSSLSEWSLTICLTPYNRK